MRRHLNYLNYVLRHKWFVLVASQVIGGSRWRALVHDVSKFRPSEWFPYAYTFYAPNGHKRYQETEAFNTAWLLHQHRNPHHWQHWVLRQDEGPDVVIEMPRKYVLEMVADWMGAGRAITGEWRVFAWYNKNKDKILLHPDTRTLVESVLVESKDET